MKKNILLALLLILSVSHADQWDFTLQDNTLYNDVDKCWMVGTTLFIVIDDELIPLNASNVVFVQEYQTEKSIFNHRRGWSYTQVGGIGGLLLGAILGTQKEKGQDVQIKNAVQSALSWGSTTGIIAYFYGGFFGKKDTRKIAHDLSGYSAGKRIGTIRRLITPE